MENGAGSKYDGSFYEFTGSAAHRSAEEIVPLLLSMTSAASVVDIGCGIGTWLASFRRHQVGDVLGLDGSYVDSSKLEIPRKQFLTWDLEERIRIDRTFDLACCLEVAEHLSEKRADTLVDDLARLAPIILFSAAIPFQGGVGHINEQWPTYWVEKFAKRGLAVVDAIRPAIWDNDQVAMWYSQNCLIFATDDALRSHPQLADAHAATSPALLNLVHPSLYLLYRLELTGLRDSVPLDSTLPRMADEPTRVSPVTGMSGSSPPTGIRALVGQMPGATRVALGTRWKRWVNHRHPVRRHDEVESAEALPPIAHKSR